MSVLNEASRVRDYAAMVEFNKALSAFAGRCPEQAVKRLEEALNEFRAGKLPREYPRMELKMRATLNVESRDPALATKIDIPNFTTPPAVVVWGKRFFIFDFNVPNNDLDNLVYVETLGYTIPATQE